jgi:hypothetical protein
VLRGPAQLIEELLADGFELVEHVQGRKVLRQARSVTEAGR